MAIQYLYTLFWHKNAPMLTVQLAEVALPSNLVATVTTVTTVAIVTTAIYSFYIFRSLDDNMISMSLYDNIFQFLSGYYSVTLFTKHGGNSTVYMKGRSRVSQES